MRNYLNGYLDILPDAQRAKIEELIRSSSVVLDGTAINEDEYAKLIQEISKQHQMLTQETPQTLQLDPVRYNKFFTGLQADLNLMFLESMMIDQALGSYERLYDGILSDMEQEIQSLREKIGNLHLVAQGEQGLIIRSFDMTNNDNSETQVDQQAHLFIDRDGSTVGRTDLLRNKDRGYLQLQLVQGKEHLRDAAGNITAAIKVVDQRGVPIVQSQYPIINAIDNSTSTYWGEVVLVDEPINVALDTAAAGGALVKFQITLPRQERVSSVSLTPFTTYPLELVSIKYEEDIETYHLPKELIPTDKPKKDTKTMALAFPEIVARRFTIMMRQANWIKNTYTVRESVLNKADLWGLIAKKEEEVTFASPTADATVTQAQVDQITGWDIYQQQLAKYQTDLANYEKRLQEWNAWKAMSDAYSTAYQAYADQITNLNRTYGTNYVADIKAGWVK